MAQAAGGVARKIALKRHSVRAAGGCRLTATTRWAAPAAPGYPPAGSPYPHLHRDWARPAHICPVTGPPSARRCTHSPTLYPAPPYPPVPLPSACAITPFASSQCPAGEVGFLHDQYGLATAYWECCTCNVPMLAGEIKPPRLVCQAPLARCV